MRVVTVSFVAVLISSLAAAAACSATSEDEGSSASASSQLRNDGRQDGASNPDKLSCGQGFTTSEVDLGGVNRTLDLGFGCRIEIDNAKQGKEKEFDWAEECNAGVTPIKIERVLARGGNISGDATEATPHTCISNAGTSGHDCGTPTGSANKGLNRIAFCFKPPVPKDAGSEPTCGNGKHDPGEECDGRSDTTSCGATKKCDDWCKCVPKETDTCGNGKHEPGEECDGRSDTTSCGATKKCDDRCKCVPKETDTCGNGKHEPGEECDGRSDTTSCGATKKCDDRCKCVPKETDTCGNGKHEPGEECDGRSDTTSCGAHKKCNDWCKCEDDKHPTW